MLMGESYKRTRRGENIHVSSKINHKLRPCHYPEPREKNNGTFLYYQLLDILSDGLLMITIICIAY